VARTGRPKAELVLTGDEREQLLRWSRRAKSAQSLALRSRIVLACAAGADNTTVAAGLGCTAATVGKWRSRFVAKRLDGLVDESRPGGPRSISDEQVEWTASYATGVTTAELAAKSGVSEQTVRQLDTL